MILHRVLPAFALIFVALSGNSRAAQSAPESTGQGSPMPVETGARRYTVEPVPAWVQPVELPQPGAAGDKSVQSGNGVEYLLVDRQIRADQGSSEYTRLVMRLVNAAGVEHSSQIALQFDPERDRLSVHSVTVRRGAQVLDELQLGRIEVLQRESSLEQGVLDGALTFHLIMSDVRVGDILEYSFTLERCEKAWGDRLFSMYSTRWDTPVARSHLRILTRAGASLNVRDSGDQQATRTRAGEWESREWNWLGVSAFLPVSDTPPWYDQSAAIQVSQFASWGEIARTALPLFSMTQPAGPELAALIGRMKSSADSDMARALASLRFVQEEVRYTGVELGERAYRPTSPDEVLQRRYGDCKDKTLLTVSILRGLGIDAAPALVSTRYLGHAREQLPSPGAFDHAIVRARIRGVTYWLDPTATAEGGDLLRYKQGTFGVALVIAPGVTDLETIPREVAPDPLIAVNAVYDFRAGLRKDATLSVVSVYRGSAADRMRWKLRSTTNEELANAYLNYNKDRYPQIRSTAVLQTHDDLAKNELKVEEAYVIGGGFVADEDGKRSFDVDAEAINEHLSPPDSPVRTTPIAMDRPVHVTEHIEMLFAQPMIVDTDSKVVLGPGFEFRSRTGRNKNNLVLDYQYQTFADEVTVAELPEFLKKREEARVNTFYSLSMDVSRDSQVANEDSKAAKVLQEASRLVQGGEASKAGVLLSELIESKDFGTLSPQQQHATWLLAASVAFKARDGARALAMMKRATDSEGAGFNDWKGRLEAAQMAQDRMDAASSLITLAQRWPGSLSDLKYWSVTQAVSQTPTVGPGRYRLLKALYDAKYTSEGFPASPWWRDLALLQLERGERAVAIETLSHILDPYVVISVLVDKRFASVRAEIQSQLDVGEIARQQIDLGRQISHQNPDKLQSIIELTYLLLYSERYEEALALCDQVIARVNESTGPKSYRDYQGYVWILDNRSRALGGLGRWDEALAQLLAASHLPELADDNVSQMINLAELYNDLSRPKEAREVLAALDADKTSGFGHVAIANELMRSALQLGDAAEVDRQLQYLREHKEDAVGTLENALVDAGREDEAAQLLIARLADLNERIPALMAVQEYDTGRKPARAQEPARVQEFGRRWRALVRRPDVQAAIAKVGSVGKYAIGREIG
jgi:transglutaminase-like putative cysteine protease